MKPFFLAVAGLFLSNALVPLGSTVAAQGACSGSAPCPAYAVPICAEKQPSPPQPKQYVHFLIKDVEVKTEDKVTINIGKISFMYKGDGIEADVAKAALGADKGECKVDLKDVTKLLETLIGSKAKAEVSTTAKPEGACEAAEAGADEACTPTCPAEAYGNANAPPAQLEEQEKGCYPESMEPVDDGCFAAER